MSQEQAREEAQRIWHQITEEAMQSNFHGIIFDGERIAKIIADALIEASKS
jgi:hypothetical protein